MDFIDNELKKEFVTIYKIGLSLRKYCNYFIVT